MHVIEHTYRCLLADVSRISGFVEIRGSVYDLQWCLNEAPKLEKHILGCIEGSTSVDLSLFPIQLRRLASASFSDAKMLRLLRQVLLFCYKAYVPHNNITVNETIKQFQVTNDQVRNVGNAFSKASPILLNSVRKHVQSVLYAMRDADFSPSHGPGASTTPKERWSKWYHSIECVWPVSDYYCLRSNREHVSQIPDLCSEEQIEAKLIAVPKDSRGPRLICVHPAEAIWAQQGLRRALERAIERVRHSWGPWPRGHIHFDDQTVNGRIALLSSKYRLYATLDMKEASDRLSETLVQVLFGPYYRKFGCCRAQKYSFKVGANAPVMDDIHSYAPMGNATTFPVQSLVFWAICVASLQYHGFHKPDSVYVFGDDILVPTKMAQFVIDDLESFGLVVNRSKSFWRSHFRESCGVDAFKGVNVTPVRWKCAPDVRNTSDLLSMSELAKRLRLAGYDSAATELYEYVREYLGKRFKLQLFYSNNPDAGALTEYTNRDYLVWRDAYWHRDYQKFVSPTYELEYWCSEAPVRDWNHVLESLTSLERTGHSSVPDRSLSRVTRLKRGWTDIVR